MGYAEPVVRLSTMLAATLPRPDRQRDVPELRLGGDRRRAEARPRDHRPARGSSPFRGGFHGGHSGDERHDVNLNYRTGYEPLLPGVYFAPYPAAYPEFGGDEERASGLPPSRSSARCSRP
jgi:hypothetical protein